jgi:hypothetical protein
MTAALVIVPNDPVRVRSASAPGGRTPGSEVGPREVRNGRPWMVRLSTGSGAVSAARLVPAGKRLLGSHR